MADSYSPIVSAAAPTLQGVWIHDPLTPTSTEYQFLYGNIGRGEELGVQAIKLHLVGRAKSVMEYGENEDGALSLKVYIPFGPDHDAGVQWWRDRVRARRSLLYRDNRIRLEYVALTKVSILDDRSGSIITAVVDTVDFSEAT